MNAAQEPRRWTLTWNTEYGDVISGPACIYADEDVPVIEASAYDALLAERDALKANLADTDAHSELLESALVSADTTIDALKAELAALKIENAEADTLNTRLGDILTLVANALKGQPDSRSLHDWSDLPRVAAALKEKAKRLHRESRETNLEYDSCDRCAATWAGDDSASERHAPGCVCAPDFLTTSATESREAKGGTA